MLGTVYWSHPIFGTHITFRDWCVHISSDNLSQNSCIPMPTQWQRCDGGERGHPDPEIRGGGGAVSQIFFRPFGPQFCLKAREGWVPRAPPLDPPLRKMIFQSVTQAVQKKGQVFSRSRTDDLGFIFSYARPTVSKEKTEVLWAGWDKLILPLMSRWVISLECR